MIRRGYSTSVFTTMIAVTLTFSIFIKTVYTTIPFLLLPQESAKYDVNLCTDFYNFACRNWINETVPDNHTVWNNWEILTKKVSEQLEKLLIANEGLGNAKQMYTACLQNGQPDHKYVHVLQTLVEDLGGWPITSSSWNERDFQWESSLARVTRVLGVYPLLKLHVFVDLQSTSRHALYIEQGESNLPPAIFIQRYKHEYFINKYKQWMLNTLHHLYPNNLEQNFTLEIDNLIDFECALSNLTVLKNKWETITDIAQLSKQFAVNWKILFKTLFHGPSKINGKIILRNPQYLKELVRLLSMTNKRTIANYIMWTVVRALSRDITEYMRKLNFEMNHILFGIKADYSRNVECIKELAEYMDTILIKPYVNHYIKRGEIKAVHNMIKNIKMRFVTMLKKNTWLDDSTKRNAIEKVSAIQHVIAFNNEIDNYAEQLRKLTLSDNHLLNIIKLRAFKSKYNIENLNRQVNFKWTDSLFEVNAYYNVLQNTIFIPAGMLDVPFFNMSAPIAYNYGALGSIIGHEFSHALDTLGRHADKNGNIHNWWQKEAIRTYEEKTNCFLEQYNNYDTNGDWSLGENIADNVGIQLSFNALSDLENLNLKGKKFGKQLFFISFAQVWCEATNGIKFEDEHAPVKTRVLATLNNQDEFFRAFNCPSIYSKCSLW